MHAGVQAAENTLSVLSEPVWMQQVRVDKVNPGPTSKSLLSAWHDTRNMLFTPSSA